VLGKPDVNPLINELFMQNYYKFIDGSTSRRQYTGNATFVT